jgi:hypothetical protein
VEPPVITVQHKMNPSAVSFPDPIRITVFE